ncbi:hypothetical protein AB852_07000 [Streptomyces uncialis]|uniref:Uncharacterized protein n=1 Tax=Streptomyces uncialis TaxID=1048205 RepID=A0A1Q4VEV1_9ACTN|nr:hypothetical protein AB852_07000 [Streptomyces uncialis]
MRVVRGAQFPAPLGFHTWAYLFSYGSDVGAQFLAPLRSTHLGVATIVRVVRGAQFPAPLGFHVWAYLFSYGSDVGARFLAPLWGPRGRAPSVRGVGVR